MGMQSSGGASSMAEDILKLIENMRCSYCNSIDATEVLNFLESEIQKYKKTADEGWY